MVDAVDASWANGSRICPLSCPLVMRPPAFSRNDTPYTTPAGCRDPRRRRDSRDAAGCGRRLGSARSSDSGRIDTPGPAGPGRGDRPSVSCSTSGGRRHSAGRVRGRRRGRDSVGRAPGRDSQGRRRTTAPDLALRTTLRRRQFRLRHGVGRPTTEVGQVGIGKQFGRAGEPDESKRGTVVDE